MAGGGGGGQEHLPVVVEVEELSQGNFFFLLTSIQLAREEEKGADNGRGVSVLHKSKIKDRDEPETPKRSRGGKGPSLGYPERF